MSRRHTDGTPLPDEITREFEDLRHEAGETLGKLREAISSFNRYQSPTLATNATNTNTNNFGGAGALVAIIVCAVCCTAMLTGGAVFAFMTSNQVSSQNDKITALEQKISENERKTDEKLSRMQDYLNAIYSIAPQLKPKEK